MSFTFNTDRETLLILPLVALAYAECSDPNCGARHLVLSIWIHWCLDIAI